MENQVNSKSTILNYGLMMAGASILLGLIQYALGMHLDTNWITGSLSFIIFIGFIVLGIKKFKALNNNLLSWGQAVKIGVGIAIVAGLIGAIYQYVFMNFIEPDMMSQIMEKQNQVYLDQGLTDEQIETYNEMSNKFKGPVIMAAFSIIGSAIGGFIVAAIAGAVMKESGENEY